MPKLSRTGTFIVKPGKLDNVVNIASSAVEAPTPSMFAIEINGNVVKFGNKMCPKYATAALMRYNPKLNLPLLLKGGGIDPLVYNPLSRWKVGWVVTIDHIMVGFSLELQTALNFMSKSIDEVFPVRD
jgi:hypothetical protein